MSTPDRIDELKARFDEHPRRYFASYANELRKSGALEEAIALCREFLPTLPGHMSGYIVFGQALYERDALEEAREVFEQALAYDPENLIALRHLGDIDRRRGDAAAARRWYERVLEADPRNDDIAAQLMAMDRTAPSASLEMPELLVANRREELPEDALGEAHAEAPVEASTPAPWEVPADDWAEDAGGDPFAFTDGEADVIDGAADGAPLDADLPFEEGLVAPEWPDTTVLAERVGAPRDIAARGETPVHLPATPEVTAAFGAEPEEHAFPEPVSEPVSEPVPEPVPEPVAEPETEAVTLSAIFEDDGDAAFDVARAFDETPAPMEAIVEAIAEDARSSGEPDEVAVFTWPEPETVSAPTSFADVHPEATAQPTTETVSDLPDHAHHDTPGDRDGAFVTETMGELLVAQGFLERAISVYEELVRRRPLDGTLQGRLNDLRQQRMAVPLSAASGYRTARERFASLAARRLSRRTPAWTRIVAEETTDLSLASLFGSGVADADDAAAQMLSGAFVSGTEMEAADGGLLASLEALPRQSARPTPLESPAIPRPPDVPRGSGAYSFDRFFPDPAQDHVPAPVAPNGPADAPPPTPASEARAADDLAEFSAWLKGLGNP